MYMFTFENLPKKAKEPLQQITQFYITVKRLGTWELIEQSIIKTSFRLLIDLEKYNDKDILNGES